MNKTGKMVRVALLIAFALVAHTVENAIPVPLAIPGAKLGLANVFTLMTLVFYGFSEAFLVAVVRTVLGSIFAGNFLGMGFALSFSGAVTATVVMAAVAGFWRRGILSLASVSIMGAAAHNTAQVAMAALLIDNPALLRVYLPILLVIAIPTGFFTGLTVAYTHRALHKALKFDDMQGGG